MPGGGGGGGRRRRRRRGCGSAAGEGGGAGQLFCLRRRREGGGSTAAVAARGLRTRRRRRRKHDSCVAARGGRTLEVAAGQGGCARRAGPSRGARSRDGRSSRRIVALVALEALEHILEHIPPTQRWCCGAVFEETAEAAKAERRGIDKSIHNRPPFGDPTSFDAPRDRCVLGRRAMTTQGARCHYKAGCPRERCGWAGPHYFGWTW